MSSKEKAKELVDKFYEKLPQLVNANDAKQCAFIAVDEIIDVIQFLDDDDIAIRYWLDVKREIRAL
jgi:hypothetical protein